MLNHLIYFSKINNRKKGIVYSGKYIYYAKKDCTGCHACYNICPTKSIDMKYDKRGFLYPNVNKSKCVNCNLCNKSLFINQ